MRESDSAEQLSTVDDLEESNGRLALVLAVAEQSSGRVGHYGTGSGSDRPVPHDATRGMTVEPDRTGEETLPEPPFVESPDDPLPPMVVPQTIVDRNRAARSMAVLTAVSRGTGFVRVVVVAAVLGTSYLGNTYQSANTIPNILFELFAAGVLQSVLVPIMVDAVDSGDRRGAEQTAGVVLGAILGLLAALVAAGMVAGPWIMRILVSGVDAASIREAEVQLGTFLLWFFLPQILFYAANLVATAVLNAQGLVRVAGLRPDGQQPRGDHHLPRVRWMRDGEAPSLSLDLSEKLVLGTRHHPGRRAVLRGAGHRPGAERVPAARRISTCATPILRRLARQGGWAAGFLALTNVLLMVVLWFSNGVEGGVVVYTLAFTVLSLPHSLFAVPVYTTSFPALTRHVNASHWRDFSDEVGRSTRSVMFFGLASTGALVALAGPLADVMAFGNASDRTTQVAGAIAAFGLGLCGFSMLLTLSRVTYAYGDMRAPTLVNVAVVVVGSLAMAVLCWSADDANRVTMVGLGFSLSQAVGALLLWWSVRHRLRGQDEVVRAVAVPIGRMVVAAGLGTAGAWALVRLLDPAGRGMSVVALVAGGALLSVVMLGVLWVVGGPKPAVALRSLGGDPGRGTAGR